MRFLVVLLMAFGSLTVLGSESIVVENTELAERVREQSHRVNRRIQREAEFMTREELRQALRLIRRLRDVVSGNPPSGADARVILLSAFEEMSSSSNRAKMAYLGTQRAPQRSLHALAQSCYTSTTWSDRASCFNSGLNGLRGTFEIGIELAKEMIADMCYEATTWSDRASCFTGAIRGAQSDELSNITIGCQGISSSANKAKCYYSALK